MLVFVLVWKDLEGEGNRHLFIYAFGPDALLLAFSCLWLNGRWRALVPAMAWGGTVFLYANILYQRYWGDIIPFSLIFDPSCYNGFVFNSIGSLLRWSDLLYLIGPAAATAAYPLMKIWKCKSLPLSAKLLLGDIWTIIFLLGAARQVIALYRYQAAVDSEEQRSVFQVYEGKFFNSSRINVLRANGFVPYLCNQLYMSAETGSRRLSGEEEKEIAAYLTKQPGSNPLYRDIFKLNRDKNVILLVVESLNAWIVDKRYDGHEVMPALDSLMNASGSIGCVHVKTQVKDGGSSDGQMIYNTGLLPIPNGSAALLYGAKNLYTSLPRLSGSKYPIEIIVEAGDQWNQRATYKAYHYKEMVECELLPGAAERFRRAGGQDMAVLQEGARQMERLEKPFFMEITTLSMHYPYEDPDVKMPGWVRELKGVGEMEKRYLAACIHFDNALRWLVAELKKKGIYDDTVIFIASDHGQLVDNPELGEDTCVFLALNTGVTEKIEKTAGQIDIFPTMLEILGRLDDSPWRGLGHSLLMPGYDGAVLPDGSVAGNPTPSEIERMREAWTISDLMIRSNYFSDK